MHEKKRETRKKRKTANSFAALSNTKEMGANQQFGKREGGREKTLNALKESCRERHRSRDKEKVERRAVSFSPLLSRKRKGRPNDPGR